MNSGKISIRYARALLMSANEKGVAEKVYQEMTTIAQAFEDYPELRTAIASPTIKPNEKHELLLAVLGGKASAESEAFLNFVISEKREDYLSSMARMFEKLYREEHKIVISTLTSATELSKESIDAIKKYISNLSGSTNVELRTQQDESLIGGFILDVEGKRLDASIKEQLKKLEYYAGH